MTLNFMPRKVKKEKPLIPEPSPRFLIFCVGAAGIVMMAALCYGFVTGSRDFTTPSAALASGPVGADKR
jgi:hypothetical protein